MVSLPRHFSMHLGRKILLLAGICLAIGVASAIVISVSSMVKLKNELSHFHDEFEISEDRVEPVEIRYNALSFQLPFGFVIDGLQFNMATTAADEHIRITVEHLSTQLQGLPAGTLKSIARNIRLASANPDKPLLREKYRIHHIDVHFVEYETMVSLLDLESSMRRVYNHLSEILERGDTNGLLSLQGTVFFEFEQNDEPIRLEQRFGTRKSGDISRIVLNREDLDLVGPQFADRLSRGDLDLVANHPLKAPRLFEIRRETEEKSREKRWSEINFPEDTYRHVLWSYLLTREYGAEFAHLVTNAHEFGSYNSEEEMAKDRENNQVGIDYAQEGVREDNILKMIQSDPRVRK